MLPATIVPIIWLQESAIFDSETRDQLLIVVSINWWTKLVKIVSFCVGACLITAYITLNFLVKYKVSSV